MNLSEKKSGEGITHSPYKQTNQQTKYQSSHTNELTHTQNEGGDGITGYIETN